jgi:hypothetical protein
MHSLVLEKSKEVQAIRTKTAWLSFEVMEGAGVADLVVCQQEH